MYNNSLPFQERTCHSRHEAVYRTCCKVHTNSVSSVYHTMITHHNSSPYPPTIRTQHITSLYTLCNEYYLIIHSIQWILPHYTLYAMNITSLYILYKEYYLTIHSIQWILPIIHSIQWILPHYTFYTMNITSLYILYNQYYLIIHSIQ
jgi:hypothetical protein